MFLQSKLHLPHELTVQDEMDKKENALEHLWYHWLKKGNRNAFWVTCLTREVPKCFWIAILRNNPLVGLKEFLY